MIKRINEAIKAEMNKLKLYCLETLKEYETEENIKVFISDLLNHGCQSGMVSNLIYYKDTNAFFDRYEEEIEDLISESMDMLGIKTRPLFIESLNGSEIGRASCRERV